MAMSSAERYRRWKKENPEKAAEASKRWRVANPAKVAARYKNWSKQNREQIAKRMRLWRAKNKEKITLQSDKWHKDNPEKKSMYNIRQKSKRRYGMSDYDINQLLDSQGFTCAICHGVDLDKKETKYLGRALPLNQDHHHLTDTNRARLCRGCNTTIGFMQESPARLRAAADYLELHAALAVGKWLAEFSPSVKKGK